MYFTIDKCVHDFCSRGASSTVRRCIEKETGIEFAAKIIDLSNDTDNREATMEEIKILRMVIGHEYISNYYIGQLLPL